MPSCLGDGMHRGAASRHPLICYRFSFRLNQCEWRRWWIVLFETASFSPEMDISNLPPELLTFSSWVLM
jgi:hypothetical protein